MAGDDEGPATALAIGDAATFEVLRSQIAHNSDQASRVTVLCRPCADSACSDMKVTDHVDRALAQAGADTDLVLFDATLLPAEEETNTGQAFAHECMAKASEVFVLWDTSSGTTAEEGMPSEIEERMRHADRIILSGRSSLGDSEAAGVVRRVRALSDDAPIMWAEDIVSGLDLLLPSEPTFEKDLEDIDYCFPH